MMQLTTSPILFNIRAGLAALGLALLLVGCGNGAAPSPGQTLTPSNPPPTAPPAPVFTPTPTALAKADLGKSAVEYLTRLIGELGPRESATEQEKKAADYISNTFSSLGYQTQIQSFTVNLLSRDTGLQLLSPETGKIESIPFSRSGMATSSGELVDLGLALEEPAPGSLNGKLALIQRGTITFQEKVARAHRAGATAAVIYNNHRGLFAGSFTETSSIPAVAISGEDPHFPDQLEWQYR